MKLNVIKNTGSLYPYAPSDIELLKKIKPCIVYQVEIKRPRNLKHHNKFMALLRLVVFNSYKWVSINQLLTALKYKLGLVDIVEGFAGQRYMIPRSINFESMKQDVFQETVYKPALELLAAEMGCTVDELEHESKDYF